MNYIFLNNPIEKNRMLDLLSKAYFCLIKIQDMRFSHEKMVNPKTNPNGNLFGGQLFDWWELVLYSIVQLENSRVVTKTHVWN
jgi:hypothetical protein